MLREVVYATYRPPWGLDPMLVQENSWGCGCAGKAAFVGGGEGRGVLARPVYCILMARMAGMRKVEPPSCACLSTFEAALGALQLFWRQGLFNVGTAAMDTIHSPQASDCLAPSWPRPYPFLTIGLGTGGCPGLGCARVLLPHGSCSAHPSAQPSFGHLGHSDRFLLHLLQVLVTVVDIIHSRPASNCPASSWPCPYLFPAVGLGHRMVSQRSLMPLPRVT